MRLASILRIRCTPSFGSVNVVQYHSNHHPILLLSIILGSMPMPRTIISLALCPFLHSPGSRRRRGFYNNVALSCLVIMSILVFFDGIVSTCADPATRAPNTALFIVRHSTVRVEPVLLPREGDVALLVYRRMLGDAAGMNGGLQVYEEGGRTLVGSSPPKCIKKCGTCEPCKSVLVPIHSTSVDIAPTQYYPEAWRCQCKGKLYNP